MLFEAIKKSKQTRSSAGQVVGGASLFSSFFGGAKTKSGITVNNHSAVTLSAFYNGINILCNDYAKLPKSVILKKDGNRKKDTLHPVHRLISSRPNQFMSRFNYDSIMLKCAVLKGNAYSEVQRNSRGQVVARQYIDEAKTPVTVKINNGNLFYCFDDRTLSAQDIEHVIGYSENGITGIGVVAHAAKSLGVALSSQEFAEDYYKTKGVGIGVVTSVKDMDDTAKGRYSSQLSSALSNSNNFKVAVLDQMGSFQHIKITPQEALFLETNKHAVEEVARWLNIPAHKLKSTSDSNYSNMESQNIDHISNSVLPWSIKFREEQEEKLFTASEKKAGYKIHHNSNSLLESDKKTQATFLSTMIYAGVFTRNEVRQLFDMNELDGLSEPLTAVNMQTMKQIEEGLKNINNE